MGLGLPPEDFAPLPPFRKSRPPEFGLVPGLIRLKPSLVAEARNRETHFFLSRIPSTTKAPPAGAVWRDGGDESCPRGCNPSSPGSIPCALRLRRRCPSCPLRRTNHKNRPRQNRIAAGRRH